jgi:hypothetical protein
VDDLAILLAVIYISPDLKLKVQTQRRRAEYAIVSHILRDVFTDLQMDQLLLLLGQTYGAAFLVHGFVG